LHKQLEAYLHNVESALQSFDNIHFERYEEEVFAPDRLNLRIRIRFLSGHLLEINEAVIIKDDSLHHLNYRYHFQNADNQLFVRYDNTPHFPDPDHFPEHKHMPEKVLGAPRITIDDLVQEVTADL